MSESAKVVRLDVHKQLSAGLHIGRLERRIPGREGAYRVLLPDGAAVEAELSPDFEPELAAECLRDNRTVMLSADGRRVTVVGSLQTSRTISRDHRDNLHIEARRVRVDAEEGMVFHVGKSTLRMDKKGAIKLTGQRMSMDVATVVRILSALVELP